ncbi:MAG: zinc ribbon domain-containing protein [Candidatus Acidiferrales bacterium]
MHPSIAQLIELQAVDLRLSDVHAKLDVLPKRVMAVNKRVETVRRQLAEVKASLTNSLKDRKIFEIDVQAWKDKARKYKDQTAQVKSNDAYKALLHEIETAEAEIATAEDRLLERMMAGEEFEARVKETEKSLKEIEKGAEVELAQIKAENDAAMKQKAALEAERKQAAGGVDEDLLDNYHRIARKHGGAALSEVKDEICTHCGVKVRPHVFQEMRRSENQEIYRCESCTRILYYVEPPPPQAQSQSASQS